MQYKAITIAGMTFQFTRIPWIGLEDMVGRRSAVPGPKTARTRVELRVLPPSRPRRPYDGHCCGRGPLVSILAKGQCGAQVSTDKKDEICNFCSYIKYDN